MLIARVRRATVRKNLIYELVHVMLLCRGDGDRGSCWSRCAFLLAAAFLTTGSPEPFAIQQTHEPVAWDLLSRWEWIPELNAGRCVARLS